MSDDAAAGPFPEPSNPVPSGWRRPAPHRQREQAAAPAGRMHSNSRRGSEFDVTAAAPQQQMPASLTPRRSSSSRRDVLANYLAADALATSSVSSMQARSVFIRHVHPWALRVQGLITPCTRPGDGTVTQLQGVRLCSPVCCQCPEPWSRQDTRSRELVTPQALPPPSEAFMRRMSAASGSQQQRPHDTSSNVCCSTLPRIRASSQSHVTRAASTVILHPYPQQCGC